MGEHIDAIRIVTRCHTVAELIEAFHPYVTADACFIPNKHARPVGTEIAFSIRLADNTSVLRGAGVVRDLWTDDANPFGRPGMRVAITRIAPQSRALFSRLVPRERLSTSAIPITRLMDKTVRTEVADRGIATVAMAPLDFALEEEPPPSRRAQMRPPRATMKGIAPLARPGVPLLVPDHGSSAAVAVVPLLWRWWIGVVAFALVVAMMLMQ